MHVEIVKRMGYPWPALGEVVDVDDGKGRFLIGGGYAVEVAAPKPKRTKKAEED